MLTNYQGAGLFCFRGCVLIKNVALVVSTVALYCPKVWCILAQVTTTFVEYKDVHLYFFFYDRIPISLSFVFFLAG